MVQLKRLRERYLASFSTDPKTLAFANYFCINSGVKSVDIATYCKHVLYECLVDDKPEIIPMYLWVYLSVAQLFQGTLEYQHVLNLIMIIELYLKSNSETSHLMSKSFLSLVNYQIQEFWKILFLGQADFGFHTRTFDSILKSFVRFGYHAFEDLNCMERATVLAYLAFNSWPSPDEIAEILHICESEFLENLQKIIIIRRRFRHLSSSSINLIIQSSIPG